MKIIIDSIDSASMRLIGYTPQPSFMVYFRGAAFSGVARLVPALDRPEDSVGMAFMVEISQESVSQFAVLDHAASSGVDALDKPGSFMVTGVIHYQSVPGDPQAQRSASVLAGEAQLELTEREMTGLWPDIGSVVRFVAHDVSLWDEAL